MNKSRTFTIAHRLLGSFGDHECITVTIPMAAWQQIPPWRFGWMPPLRGQRWPDGQSETVVVFSPELMSRVTESLDDDQLDTYLTVVETVVLAHLASPTTPSADLMRSVEDRIYAASPNALNLWSETDARAVDCGIVS